jgi:hypothetical protein
MKIKNLFTNLAVWLVFAAITLFLLAVLSLIVMLLWNWLMPQIIVCARINLFQAFLLLSLVSTLTFDKTKIFKYLYE